MTESDYQSFRQQILTTPEQIRTENSLSQDQTLVPSSVRTVISPEARERPISLVECIALALENGRVGTEGIRVLSYDPAIAAADIERSLAKFDAQWRSSMSWNNVDEPVGTATQASLDVSSDVLLEDNATFTTGIYKLLPTGGMAGITFSVPYQLSNAAAIVNPAYQPTLTFSFEQPLLRGAGVEINELRESHPGSTLQTGLDTGGGVSGILLTRINFDRSRAQFAYQVQEMLYEVERAYWNLHLSYWNLYTQDMALAQTLTLWNQARKRYEAAQLTVQDLAQLEEQYQVFRGQRLDALGSGTTQTGVLEAERQLRFAIGLPLEDGTRLIPLDTPFTAPFSPDWQLAVNEALNYRPDLLAAADNVRTAAKTLQREKDELLPDLRFTSTYDINALGNTLDGPTDSNALRNLGANRFHDWSVGLQYNFILGERAANARVHKAELQLARSRVELKNRSEQAVFEVGRTYRRIVQCQEAIRIQSARLDAASRQVQARYEEFRNGQGLMLNLIESQRGFVNALYAERSAIVAYNLALVEFERQKGTLLTHDSVTIVEGALPTCAQERASEHIREREHGLPLWTRPQPHPVDFPIQPVQLQVPLPETLGASAQNMAAKPAAEKPMDDD